MKRITITLSDEEYAALEQRAAQERRTPREMAAYLVTRPPFTVTPDWTYRPLIPTVPGWQITSGTDSISRCQVCGQVGSHLCGGSVGSGTLRVSGSTTLN